MNQQKAAAALLVVLCGLVSDWLGANTGGGFCGAGLLLCGSRSLTDD